MKVIFLDIDGVLNSSDYMRCLHRLKVNHGIGDTMDEYGQLFDSRCVNYLDLIIRETGAKIVISSTWRMGGLPKMQAMWQARSLPGEVIGITPRYPSGEIQEKYYQPGVGRGYEIQEWLEEHSNIESYVILDDDSDMLSHQKFVKCGNHYGIDYSVYKDAVEKLNTL